MGSHGKPWEAMRRHGRRREERLSDASKGFHKDTSAVARGGLQFLIVLPDFGWLEPEWLAHVSTAYNSICWSVVAQATVAYESLHWPKGRVAVARFW